MPNRCGEAKPSPVKVGLFGFLGPGNSGNEASLETILSYLRDHHPDAVIDAMSDGAEQVRVKHGIDAVPLFTGMDNDYPRHGLTGNILKVMGKAADIIGTISWVRRHDVMIVPGAGVLEATTPLRAYGFPLSNFRILRCGQALRSESGASQRRCQPDQPAGGAVAFQRGRLVRVLPVLSRRSLNIRDAAARH